METANIKTFHRKVVFANSVIKELCRQSSSLMFKVFIKINIITEVMASIALQIYQKFIIVKLRQGSGKDWQGIAVKEKGLKALSLAKSLH